MTSFPNHIKLLSDGNELELVEVVTDSKTKEKSGIYLYKVSETKKLQTVPFKFEYLKGLLDARLAIILE
jgi:hypothetical protein